MVTISVIDMSTVRIIEVIGRLDGDTAPELGQLLDRAVDEGHIHLVIDLGSVSYISSMGLREIVRIFKRAQSQNGDLRIANPSDAVMSVMELAGLDTAMNIYQTRSAAVQSFEN